MRIEDDKIIQTYQRLVEAEHPDPVGFLARAEIKTGFDYDGEHKGAVGTFGVDKKQAQSAGFDEDELSFTDTNLAAAITVDLNNLRKADGDIDEMYRLSNAGGKQQGTPRFINKLGKVRKKMQDELVFDGDQLTALKPERESKPSEGEVVYSEAADTKSADEVFKQTQTLAFQQADKSRIDDLLSKLAENIVAERPIDAS